MHLFEKMIGMRLKMQRKSQINVISDMICFYVQEL